MTAVTMLPAQPRARWMAAGAVGLGAVLAFALSLANGPRTIDDAFITYRYAANLAGGAGFIFNEGERVLGTTTPLYTLLLSAFRVLGFDLVHVSLLLGALAGAGSVVLVYLFVQNIGGSRLTAALAAALLAIALPATMGVGNGMEAHLFVLLALGAVTLSGASRPRSAVALASLAALTRPEGFLLLALVLLQILMRQRSAIASSLAVAVAVVAPWLAFAALYFGSPIPNSVQAKSGSALDLPTTAPEVRGGRRLFNHFNEVLGGPVWDFLGADAGLSVWTFAWVVPAGLIVCAVIRLVRRDLRFITIVGFPAAYFLFHLASNLGGIRIEQWYLSPLTPFYLAFTLTGAEMAAHWLLRPSWPAVGAVGCLLLVGQLAAFDLGQSGPWTLSTRSRLERERLYAVVARDLEAKVSAHTVIAAPEIGALGFHSSASILDTIGLVSLESSRFYPPDPREEVPGVANVIPTALILELQPDYVVSLEAFIRNSLLRSDAFHALYAESHVYPTGAFGSKGLYVFQRRA